MSSSCNRESLARKRTVVAVLRLVVNGAGDLTHGEVVTASSRVVARFRTWHGLAPALQVWLAREHPDSDIEEGERIDRTQPDPPTES